MPDNQDITLNLRIHNGQGNFLGGTVDIELKHRTLSDRVVQRGADASREIAISGLRRAPIGDYQVTVTPTDVFKPQSQFINLPASGFATMEFVFRQEGHDVPPPEVGADAGSLPLPITGVLVNGANSYPLVGLRVRAFELEATQDGSKGVTGQDRKESLLGESVSDSSGRFAIVVENKSLVLQQLSVSPLILNVENPNGQLYLRAELPVGGSHFVGALSVPLPSQPISPAVWQDIGARMGEARIVQLHELARHLVLSESSASLFGDWGLELRHSVLTELEGAFLDPSGLLRANAAPPSFRALQAPGAIEQYGERLKPHFQDPQVRNAFAEMRGKLYLFDSLLGVDWVVDPSAFGRAGPAVALGTFLNLYRSTSFATRDGLAELGERFDDPIRYRDYLRTTWAVIAKNGKDIGLDLAIMMLDQRFHQSFRTKDLTEVPANQLLIQIFSSILTSPKGDPSHGFAIPMGTIEAVSGRPARVYLDYLISLTKLSARDLGLRFRVNLERPDTVLSTEVHENIATLQGFFRDTFQCEPEPFAIIPDDDVTFPVPGPFFPGQHKDRAPFFLEYEEWLHRKAPFYPENFYQLRKSYFLNREQRDYIKGIPEVASSKKGSNSWWLKELLKLDDVMRAGDQAFDEGQYQIARTNYSQVAEQLRTGGLVDPTFKAGGFSAEALDDFTNRHALPMKTMAHLESFMEYYASNDPQNEIETTKKLKFGLVYFAASVLPTVLGDVALALGDYPTAVRSYGRCTTFLVGIAEASDPEGYLKMNDIFKEGAQRWPPRLYSAGSLPYTVKPFNLTGVGEDTIEWWPDLRLFIRSGLPHRMEEKFFRLRLGNAMLEWADALYRTDDSSSKARARELYKGVLLLHNEMPPIAPSWPEEPLLVGLVPPASLVSFVNHTENPALALQKNRARLGFKQLEAGLNYFGYDDDEVPILRYRTLKDAAERFTALAKAAQTDFLAYMEKIEDAFKVGLLTGTLLKKAALHAQIAGEQTKIAEFGVGQAKEQRAQVEEAIKAKEEEISKKEDFFSQVGDFASGFKDALASIPSEGKSFVSSGISAEGIGLTAGAGVMGAYALFVYGGYVSLNGMADASNKRQHDLATLRDKSLPAANALILVKQREETIARLQGQIAKADTDLAQDLITFQASRFLNTEFWLHLAGVMQRVLRRYLDLGARFAWLAERFLSYEQDRGTNIIQLDYFPLKLQGVTGADLLQLDLAELEASRVDGLKQDLPVKHTFSLARDYPFHFGRLKQTGRCTFRTEELPFQQAYPGTYGYRLKAVTIAVERVLATPPVRGLLTNQGISSFSRSDGTINASARPREAFPISEFRLREDMRVYDLPGETLLTFEGSGLDTFWELEFPEIANTYGLDHVTDLLFTLDARAHYSIDLYKKHLASAPATAQRLVFVSALKLQPKSIDAIRGSTSTDAVGFDFDFASVGLPKKESNRTVKNLVIFVVDKEPLDFSAVFKSTRSATSAAVSFQKGIALSNRPLLAGSPAATTLLPLDAFVEMDMLQTFNLTITKSKNPGVDFSGVTDLVLGIEYLATLKA